MLRVVTPVSQLWTRVVWLLNSAPGVKIKFVLNIFSILFFLIFIYDWHENLEWIYMHTLRTWLSFSVKKTIPFWKLHTSCYSRLAAQHCLYLLNSNVQVLSLRFKWAVPSLDLRASAGGGQITGRVLISNEMVEFIVEWLTVALCKMCYMTSDHTIKRPASCPWNDEFYVNGTSLVRYVLLCKNFHSWNGSTCGFFANCRAWGKGSPISQLCFSSDYGK